MNDENPIYNQNPAISGVSDECYTPLTLFTVSDSVNAWISTR